MHWLADKWSAIVERLATLVGWQRDYDDEALLDMETEDYKELEERYYSDPPQEQPGCEHKS